MVVAFSCKQRGFGPSCCGPRVADVAAHSVDAVLPKVQVCQWVCALPSSVRTALAYDRELCSDVLDAFFTSALARSRRRRARTAHYQAGARSTPGPGAACAPRPDGCVDVHAERVTDGQSAPGTPIASAREPASAPIGFAS
jgi:hypothetical protein